MEKYGASDHQAVSSIECQLQGHRSYIMFILALYIGYCKRLEIYPLSKKYILLSSYHIVMLSRNTFNLLELGVLRIGGYS
jgi:hypothetical protein